MTTAFGNASSLEHNMVMKRKKRFQYAVQVAQLVGASPKEVISLLEQLKALT